MQLVAIGDIIVPPNRIRRQFDLQGELELAESIANQGLFHPPLLRQDGKTIVAGERRLRAIRLLVDSNRAFRFDSNAVPLGMVPCVRLDEADAVGLLEAELNENIHRQQLTWQEQAETTAALHRLRQAQNPAHTVTDTIAEIVGPNRDTEGNNREIVTEDLLVAEHLDDEDVAKAASRKDAVKIITRKREDQRRQRLAAEFGVVARSGDATLIRGDLFEVIPTLDANSFDLLIADPPYGVNAGEWQNQSAVQHHYSDMESESDKIYSFLAGEAGQRVLRNEAHAYLFCDVRRHQALCSIFRAVGWRVWPWPLIWHRGTGNGLVPWPEHGPRRTFDGILFAVKGNRRTTGIRPDMLIHPHDSTVEFGAHKPVDLYRDLIQRSCVPGNRVLDPCAGSGPVLDAAKREHVYVTAIEIDAGAHGQAVERLKKL